MIELYLNGKLCDLTGEDEIAIDYAMFSIDDITKRKGSRSYTFQIPKTAKNKIIIENADEWTSETNLPYTKLDARVLADGVDIGIRFGELVSCSDSYSVNLYGNNATFFDAIKNKKLIDLDLSQYDHFWNFDNVKNSRTNTAGYIYPLIDYSADGGAMDNTNRTCHPQFMLPSIFADTVLNQIAADAGYSLVNKIESDANYSSAKLLLPHTKGYVTRNLQNTRYLVEFEETTDQTVFQWSFGEVDLIFRTCNTPSSNYFVNPTTITFGQPVYQFADNINIEGRLIWEIDNADFFSHNMQIHIQRLESNGDGTWVTKDEFIYISVAAGVNTYTIPFSYMDKPLIQIQFKALMLDISITTIKAGSKFKIDTCIIHDALGVNYFTPVVKSFEYITISASLPDMKQSDFLSAYMRMYGLLPIVDEITKTFTLEKFDAVENNINSVLNWSDKIDLTDEPEIKFLVDEYGQRNVFKYSQDGDEAKPIGTDGAIDISNANLELEKEIVELDFSSSQSFSKLIDIPVPAIGCFDAGVLENDKNPRLLLLYLKDAADFADTSNLTYNDGTNSSAVSTNFPLVRFIDESFTYNLGFDNSLLDLFYIAIRGILDKYRIVTCNLKLNESDINQIDFMKPVYIQYFESYFYVNAIKGYKPDAGEITSVELVKLF